MESKIPLPTDNIYKFYALFGLLLFISSLAAYLYLHKSTNELIFETAVIVEELETREKPSAADIKRKEMAEKRVSIAVEDRKAFNSVLAFLALLGASLMGLGFAVWQFKVQPLQDKLLNLQIQKAEQELQKPLRVPFKAQKP